MSCEESPPHSEPATVSGDEDTLHQFKDALKPIVGRLLDSVRATESGMTFQNLSKSSASVDLISSIVSEKLYELMETTLRLSTPNTISLEPRTPGGTWETVLAAATLANTPPR